MKVDLHSHTADHSACSTVSAVEMVRAAKARGLDGLVISDHHHHLTDAERRALQRAVPGIRVFRGTEIGVGRIHGRDAEWEDLVVVSGVPCPHVASVPADQVDRLGDFVRRSGALTILAHPFRYHEGIAFDLDRFTPDAVEIASLNVDAADHDRIAELAARHGMRLVSNSDTHHTNEVALFYVDLDDEVDSELELADAIRRGAFTLAAHEPALRQREVWVEPLERLARRVLERGGGLEEFLAAGGAYAAIFARVADGGSHLPNRRALGLRNVGAPTRNASG